MPRKKKPIPDYDAIVREYDKEIAEIDAMPYDGPRNIPRHIRETAFQIRRDRQVDFILSVWDRFFTGREKPLRREVKDLLGIIETDRLRDAMDSLASAATRQHKGRGNKINQQERGVITNYVTGTGRTRRKILSPMGYWKDDARRMFGKKKPLQWSRQQNTGEEEIPY